MPRVHRPGHMRHTRMNSSVRSKQGLPDQVVVPLPPTAVHSIHQAIRHALMDSTPTVGVVRPHFWPSLQAQHHIDQQPATLHLRRLDSRKETRGRAWDTRDAGGRAVQQNCPDGAPRMAGPLAAPQRAVDQHSVVKPRAVRSMRRRQGRRPHGQAQEHRGDARAAQRNAGGRDHRGVRLVLHLGASLQRPAVRRRLCAWRLRWRPRRVPLNQVPHKLVDVLRPDSCRERRAARGSARPVLRLCRSPPSTSLLNPFS